MTTSPWDQPAPEPAQAARPNVAGLDLAALRRLMVDMGESPFRATQIHQGLYQQRWTAWAQFTSLSKALRTRLERETELRWPEVVESAASEDGSTKHAFRLQDGTLIEGVHMPYPNRTTLCLSSQVGCAMG